MRVSRQPVTRGGWIRVEEANPRVYDKVVVSVDDHDLYAFVEGSDVLVRCPTTVEPGIKKIAVNGEIVGSVKVI